MAKTKNTNEIRWLAHDAIIEIYLCKDLVALALLSAHIKLCIEELTRTDKPKNGGEDAA